MTQASTQTKTDNKTAPHTPAATSAKPTDKPTDKPADKPAGSGGAEAAPAVKKGSSRIFIATGPIFEFETTAKAEKFLNGGGETPAPTEYTVLRGKRIGTSKKVSLR